MVGLYSSVAVNCCDWCCVHVSTVWRVRRGNRLFDVYQCGSWNVVTVFVRWLKYVFHFLLSGSSCHAPRGDLSARFVPLVKVLMNSDHGYWFVGRG